MKRIQDETISGKIAKEIFALMWVSSKEADEIITEQGLQQITDSRAIEPLIDQIMAQFPEQLADYRSGKERLFGFFVGQVMKACSGKANPQQVNDLLKR